MNVIPHQFSGSPEVETGVRQLIDRGQRLEASESKSELREAFDAFVGETFFGLMLKTMRESTSRTPYFHGGRGEEVFQKQLDQQLVERVSAASAESFTEPMFELFNLRRL